MKVFKRSGMSLEDINEMLGEAVILSRIGHPNIVRVFDANIVESNRGVCGYFTMENVTGGSLEKFWRSHAGRLVPIETTMDLIKQVCRGIAQAHREDPPIIHRDIKPQNVLVGYESDGLRARVSDFGLAKTVNPLTLHATAAGTLAFKAPEAFEDYHGDSCAGDVWAIGTTLYLLLTNKLPYPVSADFAWGAPGMHKGTFSPPSKINPGENENLDFIVQKALEKNSYDRYQTAKELLEALENWTPARDGAGVPRREADNLLADTPSPAAEVSAEALSRRALIARQEGRLADAADLMEQAFIQSGELRAKYAHQVKLWRCGISM